MTVVEHEADTNFIQVQKMFSDGVENSTTKQGCVNCNDNLCDGNTKRLPQINPSNSAKIEDDFRPSCEDEGIQNLLNFLLPASTPDGNFINTLEKVHFRLNFGSTPVITVNVSPCPSHGSAAF